MDGLMDGWKRKVIHPVFRPSILPQTGQISGRNGWTDLGGSGFCPSVHKKRSYPCIFGRFLWMDGWTDVGGGTP